MATTTPNYLWSVPTSSDLVKNGATAIETLGDSVDASLWSSGYGQAGKNKIINGDFTVNQRSFTTTTTSSVYTFDRFVNFTADGTATYSAQTFTPGAAPVAGYEGKNYLNIATTGQTLTTAATLIGQNIENVRTLAGQTATVSFWAKAASGTPKIAVELRQFFGSGGSPSAAVSIYAGQVTLSTSWARYSVTIAVPSLSGKTIGTTDTTSFLHTILWTSAGSSFNSRTGSLGIQNATIDIWGVQVEAGSTATPFQTASGGSIQGELAMCQRYYYRATFDSAIQRLGVGYVENTTTATIAIPFPVTMRTKPTALEQSGTAGDYSVATAGTNTTCSAVPTFSIAGTDQALTLFSVASGLVAGQGAFFRNVNTSAYLGWVAEY